MQNKINYIHGRQLKFCKNCPETRLAAFGGFTAAWIQNDEKQCIDIWFTKCSNKDRYNKKIGRGSVDKLIKTIPALVIPVAFFQENLQKSTAEIIRKTSPVFSSFTINDFSSYIINLEVHAFVVAQYK